MVRAGVKHGVYTGEASSAGLVLMLVSKAVRINEVL
jgi:hypothetical protein